MILNSLFFVIYRWNCYRINVIQFQFNWKRIEIVSEQINNKKRTEWPIWTSVFLDPILSTLWLENVKDLLEELISDCQDVVKVQEREREIERFGRRPNWLTLPRSLISLDSSSSWLILWFLLLSDSLLNYHSIAKDTDFNSYAVQLVVSE